MRLKLMPLAGALSMVLTAVDMTGMAEAKGRHRHHGGNKPNHSVPEPNALYALGSAVALLGGAGWVLRRK
jgi:hypothetical protein